MDKIDIPATKIDSILDLVRLALPLDNNLPLSYTSTVTEMSITQLYKQHAVCFMCDSAIEKSKICTSDICPNYNIKKKSSKALTSNIVEQLKVVFNNHLGSMIRYKGTSFFYYYDINYRNLTFLTSNDII